MLKQIVNLAFVLLMSMHLRAQSAKFNRDFSADVITHSAGRDATARYYASQGRTRMETLRNGQVTYVMIIDFGAKKIWQLRPEEKVATDMSDLFSSGIAEEFQRQKPDPNNPCSSMPGSTCHKLGNESVNGRHTEKWEVKENGGKTTYFWIDPTLPIAVKTQSANFDGEFRNIKEGPQPNNLFEVPSDYRKMSFGLGTPH